MTKGETRVFTEEHNKLFDDVSEVIGGWSPDDIIPLFTTFIANMAAQTGVPQDKLMSYLSFTINSAYELYKRDEDEVVH